MDADTRHQLKKNELAEALGKLGDFSDKSTIAWLIVIIVVVLGYAGAKYWRWQEQSRQVEASRAILSIDASDPALGDAPLAQLRQIIADHDGDQTTALARLKLAEGLQARARGADEAANLDKAEQEFKSLLGLANVPAHIRAVALFRLGLLYESKRDFAQAKETYQKLIDDSACVGSPFQELARVRVAMADELAKPVKFTPGVKPLPAPTITPASAPATAPAADAEAPAPAESSGPEQP